MLETEVILVVRLGSHPGDTSLYVYKSETFGLKTLSLW